MEILVREIVERVALEFDLTPDDIKGPARRRDIATARQACYRLARRMSKKSLPSIGRSIGDRDHTTIRDGLQRIEKKMEKDPDLAHRIDQLERDMEHDFGVNCRVNVTRFIPRRGPIRFMSARDKARSQVHGPRHRALSAASDSLSRTIDELMLAGVDGERLAPFRAAQKAVVTEMGELVRDMRKQARRAFDAA